MSPQRRRMSERSGIRNLGGHPVTDHRFKGVGCHQVDGGAERSREELLELDKREEPDRPGELDENIDIACLGLFTACERAEDTDPADGESRGKLTLEALQGHEDFFPGTAWILVFCR